jgi:hypothetical protein
VTRSLATLAMLTLTAGLMSACGGGSSTPATSATSSTVPAATSAATAAAVSAKASSAGASSAGATSAAATSAAVAAPTSAAAGGGSTSGCDNAAVAVNKATNASTQSEEVISIDLAGGCATVVVASAIPTGNAVSKAAAVQLCNTVATPAYANGVSAVKIIAVDGTSVAASGKKGSPCVAATG